MLDSEMIWHISIKIMYGISILVCSAHLWYVVLCIHTIYNMHILQLHTIRNIHNCSIIMSD